jgi:hypothetical protein
MIHFSYHFTYCLTYFAYGFLLHFMHFFLSNCILVAYYFAYYFAYLAYCQTYSLTADVGPGVVGLVNCCATGLGVFAKASHMHPSEVDHVLPWESNPIFTRRRGGSKRGGDAVGFPSPRSSAHLPLAGCVGSGHLGSCLMDLSVLAISQIILITALSGVGNSDHTRLHGTPTWISIVDGMSGYAMTLSSPLPAHYTRAPAASRHGSVS